MEPKTRPAVSIPVNMSIRGCGKRTTDDGGCDRSTTRKNMGQGSMILATVIFDDHSKPSEKFKGCDLFEDEGMIAGQRAQETPVKMSWYEAGFVSVATPVTVPSADLLWITDT